MFRLTVLGLFVASVAVAAPVPKVKEAKLYYPVTVGAERVMERYRDAGGQKMVIETIEEITGVEMSDGKHRVTIAQENYMRIWVNGEWTARRQLFREKVLNRTLVVSGDGLLASPPANKSMETSHPLLDLTVKPGATWEAKLLGGSTTNVTYTMGKEEEVQVPAGKFLTLRVDCECNLGTRTQKTTEWYAPCIGVIKRVNTFSDGQEDTTVLVRFVPRKEVEVKTDSAEDESRGK